MNYRKADYPILDIIINRWSSRALSGEPMSDEELFPLFEAARWAPSSYNNQPWHFIYTHRDSPAWFEYLDLLVPFNRSWAQKAAVLILVASDTLFEKTGKISRTHLFDTGAAWENLALQGTAQGLVVHGMEGFDYDKARQLIDLPDRYELCAMIAIGKPGKVTDLPEDLQSKETPSGRKPIQECISQDRFK
jgi:nitroreductase